MPSVFCNDLTSYLGKFTCKLFLGAIGFLACEQASRLAKTIGAVAARELAEWGLGRRKTAFSPSRRDQFLFVLPSCGAC